MNFNDPQELEPQEGRPETQCYVNGSWWPAGYCDVMLGFQRPNRQLTQFDRATIALSAAQETLASGEHFSTKCIDGLGQVHTAGGGAVDPQELANEAMLVSFGSGPSSNLSVADANGDPTVGRAAQFAADSQNNSKTVFDSCFYDLLN